MAARSGPCPRAVPTSGATAMARVAQLACRLRQQVGKAWGCAGPQPVLDGCAEHPLP